MRSWRHLTVAVAIGAVAALGCVAIRTTAQNRVAAQDSHRVDLVAIQVENSVTQATGYVDEFRRYLARHADVTPEAFSSFAAEVLGSSGLADVAWVQPVTDIQRTGYEQSLGHPILDITPDGTTRPAPFRPVYYPATLATSGDRPLTGVDLGGPPEVRDTISGSAPLYGVAASDSLALGGGQPGRYFIESAARLTSSTIVPGLVVVFVPDAWLLQSVGDEDTQVRFADGAVPGGRAAHAFTEASRQWQVTVPRTAPDETTDALAFGLLGAGLAIALLVVLVGRGSAARQRTRAELDRIFALSRDVICTAGFDGYFKRVNPAFGRILGYSTAELLGRPYLDFIHEEDRERTAAEAQALTEGHETVNFQNRYCGRDGSARWLEWTALGVPEQRLIYATARDVTERKQYEADREQREEALRRSQRVEAMGLLAGGVAHDFNNLLLVIIGYSEMMLDEVGPDSPWRRDLEEIAKASERAASLTHQLLAFSRQQALQPKVLDLNTVVANVDRLLRRLIGEEIQISAVLGSGLWSVMADAGQLEQIVVNLAVNARDAMPDGGKLTIETANLEVDAAHPAPHPDVEAGRYVVLRVCDTGNGMDEPTRARAFEPFFTTKPTGHGTGLGLSTVYGIVEQSGGEIRLESEPGLGTTIVIYFPALPVPQHSEAPDPGASQAVDGSEVVLLVEDDDQVRTAVARFLRLHGYRVLEAQDGNHALRLSRQLGHSPDIVVTDVRMPGLRGPDLVRRLPHLRPETPVLYISGNIDSTPLDDVLSQPTVALIHKPFTADTLARQVRHMLDTRTPQRS
jgi:PAS domain S-box-containing protein